MGTATTDASNEPPPDYGMWWVVEVQDRFGWRYLDWARFTTEELAVAHHATITETRPTRVVERPAENHRRTA